MNTEALAALFDRHAAEARRRAAEWQGQGRAIASASAEARADTWAAAAALVREAAGARE